MKFKKEKKQKKNNNHNKQSQRSQIKKKHNTFKQVAEIRILEAKEAGLDISARPLSGMFDYADDGGVPPVFSDTFSVEQVQQEEEGQSYVADNARTAPDDGSAEVPFSSVGVVDSDGSAVSVQVRLFLVLMLIVAIYCHCLILSFLCFFRTRSRTYWCHGAPTHAENKWTFHSLPLPLLCKLRHGSRLRMECTSLPLDQRQ